MASLLASPQSADPRRRTAALAGRPRSHGGRLVVGTALAAKVLLAGCLLHALAFPGLVQYRDKAVGCRLVAYPALLALVPLAVLLRRRRRGSRVPAEKYPWLVDLCAALPFLFDSLGNAANLYDTVSWWDDAMHIVTWAPLVVAFGLVVRRRVDDPVLLAGLCLSFGAVTCRRTALALLADAGAVVGRHGIDPRLA